MHFLAITAIFRLILGLYRHDPAAPDALVMKSPTKEHARKFNKKYVVVTSYE